MLDLSLTLSISFSDYLPTYLGTRLAGGREDFSTPAMLSICFSADFQWSEHSSPFWKLIACARVRCKRIVDSVAANPREYLVRRAAKNVISPPQNPPQETTMQKSRVSCKLQEEVDSLCQGTVQEKSG